MPKTYDGLVFDDNARRAALQADLTLNGIDYLEVDTTPESDNQRVLRVYFLPPQDSSSTKLDTLLNAALTPGVPITISGGVRIQSISIIQRSRVDDVLVLRVNQPGDFSDYTLKIESNLLDPFYSQIVFNFKVACPSHFDCKPVEDCPPEPTEAPAIDYMAKDYASFRQALIDLIPTLAPDWTERRPADFGLTLLELLAYAGDQLSYLQDAIANEPYLETARQRLSVRRHARLIDYAMHDGLSAATFLHFTISGAAPVTVSGVIQAVALPRGIQPSASRLPLELQDAALKAADAIFEVMTADQPLHLSSRLNTIPIYAWGNQQVYLPRGATSADLEGDLAWDAAHTALWRLKPGDWLLFEEIKDPVSGVPADADPAHRQVVRLTLVAALNDPLVNPPVGQPLTHVEWAAADALTFPVCVASVNPNSGVAIPGVSVARGNLAVAYHGQTR